jgi:hypothetical protein
MLTLRAVGALRSSALPFKCLVVQVPCRAAALLSHVTQRVSPVQVCVEEANTRSNRSSGASSVHCFERFGTGLSSLSD